MTERHDRRLTIRHLCDDERLTFAQIGEHFGISPQAALQAYQRAVQPKQLCRTPRKATKYQGLPGALTTGLGRLFMTKYRGTIMGYFVTSSKILRASHRPISPATEGRQWRAPHPSSPLTVLTIPGSGSTRREADGATR
jgi:hypothetical protein